MMQNSTIWSILQRHVPRSQWVTIGEIFDIVESHGVLDEDDLKLRSSNIPKWKLTVRRLLENKKRDGRIQGRGKQ